MQIGWRIGGEDTKQRNGHASESQCNYIFREENDMKVQWPKTPPPELNICFFAELGSYFVVYINYYY